jgi:AcrR family transcriptional regulator
MNLVDGDGPDDRLLDVAEEVFAERGFKGATVREIAGRVKRSASYVSTRFGGKGGLYQAVFERLIRGRDLSSPSPLPPREKRWVLLVAQEIVDPQLGHPTK